jgi:hypothetical protein
MIHLHTFVLYDVSEILGRASGCVWPTNRQVERETHIKFLIGVQG